MSKLVGVNLFPVKGARPATALGAPLERVTATRTGFEHLGVGDREVYAVAPSSDTGDLMVITPRGRTRVNKGRDGERPEDRPLKAMQVDIVGERQIRVTAARVGSLAIDLDRRPGPSVKASIHKGEIWGFDLGADAQEFLYGVTGRPNAHLMRVDRSAVRTAGPGVLRNSLASDSQPISLGVVESLAAINAQSGQVPVDMLRYRPGAIVDELDGRGPFAEHLVRRMTIGKGGFNVIAGIFRCVVTNLNEHGEFVGGGLRALRSRVGVRVGADGLAESGQPEPIFCVSMQAEVDPGGSFDISAGDPVTVLEWGNSPNCKILGEHL